MLRAFGVVALLCAALPLLSYQRYVDHRPIADTWEDSQYEDDSTFDELEDEQDLEPLPPPNAYIRGEKKDMEKNIGKQGVGQIKLKDRPDSRTKKERTEGPSLPTDPNKGGG